MHFQYLIAILFLVHSLPHKMDNDHAIYITVIELNHDTQSILVKTFSDDLADAIRSDSKAIISEAQICTSKPRLKNYIENHLHLTIEGESMELSISDCYIASDTHWVKLSYESPNDVKDIQLQTTWLTDLFLDQQNIIKVNWGDQKQHIRLNAEQTDHVFHF